jgi:hypothetical protein
VDVGQWWIFGVVRQGVPRRGATMYWIGGLKKTVSNGLNLLGDEKVSGMEILVEPWL